MERVITWFDALLVTLWAVVTALGARRGLAGLAWGLGGVLVCFVSNLLARAAIPAAILTLLLSLALSVGVRRLLTDPLSRPWFPVVGGLGGFALGAVLVMTLTLGFPIGIRVGTEGKTGIYPSVSLPPFLYSAVDNSALKNRLSGVWQGGRAVQLLLVPDQVWQAR